MGTYWTACTSLFVERNLRDGREEAPRVLLDTSKLVKFHDRNGAYSKAEVSRTTSSTLHAYLLLLAYLLEAGHIEEGVAVVQCSGTHHPRVVREALEVGEQEEQAAVPVREEEHEEHQL